MYIVHRPQAFTIKTLCILHIFKYKFTIFNFLNLFILFNSKVMLTRRKVNLNSYLYYSKLINFVYAFIKLIKLILGRSFIKNAHFDLLIFYRCLRQLMYAAF